MDEITLKPIGLVHSPFEEPRGTPIQATGRQRFRGTVEVFEEYADGLTDLGGFSHIVLICYLHLTDKTKLKVTPFLDTVRRGVFATRAPSRPNHIGLTIVRLLEVDGRILHVEDLDIVDGTPLLDIKPYVPNVDARQRVRIGWLEGKIHKAPHCRADDRFTAD